MEFTREDIENYNDVLGRKGIFGHVISLWRAVIDEQKKTESRGAAVKTIARGVKKLWSGAATVIFYRWRNFVSKQNEVISILAWAGRKLDERKLAKAMKLWVGVIFLLREEAIQEQYTYKNVKNCLLLSRKVLERVYLERLREAYFTWVREIKK